MKLRSALFFSAFLTACNHAPDEAIQAKIDELNSEGRLEASLGKQITLSEQAGVFLMSDIRIDENEKCIKHISANLHSGALPFLRESKSYCLTNE